MGDPPNQISVFRHILACFTVSINSSTDFILVGQDLRVLPKKTLILRRPNDTDFSKLANLMPYKLYSYNSLSPIICFNVEDVSRPACFVSINHGRPAWKRSRESLPVPHESIPQFWGFPLSYCDRSLYAGVSIGQTENAEAVQNGLRPYILHTSEIPTILYSGNGGEDSGDEDVDLAIDIDHEPAS